MLVPLPELINAIELLDRELNPIWLCPFKLFAQVRDLRFDITADISVQQR